MNTITDELEQIRVWLAYGYDERQLDAFDTGLDFRGLADAIYLPAADFEIWIADQDLSADFHIDRYGSSDYRVVEMWDDNSGTLYRYEPEIYRGQIVYLVESFGFTRVER